MATLDEQYANIVKQYSGTPVDPITTELSPLDQQYADVVNQYTQPTAMEQKQFNLSQKVAEKQKRLGTTNRTDSLAYEYQDVLNPIKGAINYLLPDSMELDKYEVGDDNKLYILDEDTNKRLAAGYFGKDKEGNEVFRGEGGNDGDTYDGIRMLNMDTPESVFDNGDDSKFKRVTDRYGISYEEQLSAGNIAKQAGAEFLKANPDTQATKAGKDYYGRDLASSDAYESFMIANGYAVPSENASADYVKAYEDAKANGLGLHGSHPDVLEALSIDARAYQNKKTGGHEDNLEFIDAFQAGAIGLSGRGIKAFGQATTSFMNNFRDAEVEGDGSIEKLGKRLQAEANEIAGYNPSTLEAGTFKLQKAMRSAVDGKPDIGLYISGLVDVAPQVAAGSIPDILAFAGAAAAGTAASGGNVGVGWMAGMATMGSVNANDSLDEREQLNGGKKATPQEFAAVLAAESVASALDYGAFKFVTGGKVLYKGSQKAIPMEKAFKITSHQGKAELALALAKTVGRGGAAFGTEAVQEGTTEAIRILAKELGTEPHEGESLIDALSRNAMNIATAASLGGAGGTTIGAAPNAKATYNDVNQVRKRAQAKQTASEAGSDAESQVDAENKQFFADQDVDVAKDEYTNLTTIHDSINEANTREEILKALDESPATKLDETDPTSGVSSIEQMKASIPEGNLSPKDIEGVKEALTGDLRNVMSIIATEGRNKKTASESLGKAIEKGDLPIEDGTVSQEAFDAVVAKVKDVKSVPYRSTLIGTIKNVLGGGGTPKDIRKNLKSKLNSISNKALDTLLANEDAIKDISDAFILEGTKKSAASPEFIDKIIKERIAKRVKSDVNLKSGVTDKAKDGEVSSRDILDSADDVQIADTKLKIATDDNIEEVIATESESRNEAANTLLTNIAKASRKAQDDLVKDIKGSDITALADKLANGNKKLAGRISAALRTMKKNTSVQGRKSYVVSQARSKTADLKDLEYGLTEVEKLKEEGHISEKEYTTLQRTYAAVKERSEEALAEQKAEAKAKEEVTAKEEQATKAKKDREAIDEDPELTEDEKSVLKDMPENIRQEMLHEGLDEEAIRELKAQGLDVSQLENGKIVIKKCEG